MSSQVVDNYEYELPLDFEDEEIDEDAAFTEEDKKLYAGWFGGSDAAPAENGEEGSEDGLLNSDEEADGDGESYYTDDFSAEVSPLPLGYM